MTATPTDPATTTTAPSRTPSPAPTAPVAETPGPRAQGLINVFFQASKATLDKCSAANFASCFPTAAQYSPETLEELRCQIVSQLERAWKGNFEDILRRREVVRLLNELDACVEEARRRRDRDASQGGEGRGVPPHTLPPASIHLAHLAPFLDQQAGQIKASLAETQQANADLLPLITAQRAEIETLVRGLDAVVKDLETSAATMAGEDVQGLGGEIRTIERGMRT